MFNVSDEKEREEGEVVEDISDVVADTDDSVELAEEYLGDKVQKLKEELKACKKERQEFLDGWQRSKADFLNSKKRYENERAESVRRTQADVIEKLLALSDSFDMAFKDKGAWDAAPKVWAQGIERIFGQLQTILREYGVVEVPAQGEPFDPALHEAYASAPVDDEAKHDTVIEVAQKGYRMGDALIRPARVIIGAYTKK